MRTIYSSVHGAHRPSHEFEHGRLSPAVEIPERAERVRAEIEARKLGPVAGPKHFPDSDVFAAHDRSLVNFLSSAYQAWHAQFGDVDAIASAWPARGMGIRDAGDIEARLGAFSFDTATPIMRGTWKAAREAADVALSAAEVVEGGNHAFALTRPPGHHASANVFGGYCYLNNIAIAAAWLAKKGRRVALLDVDYHHGNGTQAIFYSRSDVLFVSIHADPSFAFPHFLGYSDESGAGAGLGFNLNVPLPAGTDWLKYREALGHAIRKIAEFGADALLVSLGLDTFEDDPIARFALKRRDYLKLGKVIADLKLPTAFVFEGGYNVEALGEITANVLEGFADG